MQNPTNDAAQLRCAMPSLVVAFFPPPSISDVLPDPL